MTDIDDAMARAVDIGENEVSLIVFSTLALIIYFIHSWKWLFILNFGSFES